MARLTLRLPASLHQSLSQEAEREGVSLNQYLVFLLARRDSPRGLVWVSDRVREKQAAEFHALIRRLGPFDTNDVQAALDGREAVESDLEESLVERLRERLAS